MIVTNCHQGLAVSGVKGCSIDYVIMSKFREAYAIVPIPHVAMLVLSTTVKNKYRNVFFYTEAKFKVSVYCPILTTTYDL